MKKLKIYNIVFLILSTPTFIYGLFTFHSDIFIQLFGKILFTLIDNKINVIRQTTYTRNQIFCLWSLLSIPIGLGLLIINVLKKQWFIFILLLIATFMSGLLAIVSMAIYVWSRAFSYIGASARF